MNLNEGFSESECVGKSVGDLEGGRDLFPDGIEVGVSDGNVDSVTVG